MYVSKAREGIARVSSMLQIVSGTILSIFFGFGVIMSVADYEDTRKWFLMYAACLAFSLLPLFLAARKRRDLAWTRQFNAVFLQDQDGVMPLRDLAEKTGLTEEETGRRLRRLLQKGYIINCTLNEGPVPSVNLRGEGTNAKGTRHPSFVRIVCPSCGAEVLLRSGGTGKCEYCGNYLKA